MEPFKTQRPENALRTLEPCQREYSARDEKLYVDVFRNRFILEMVEFEIHSGGGK